MSKINPLISLDENPLRTEGRLGDRIEVLGICDFEEAITRYGEPSSGNFTQERVDRIEWASLLM